jgi:hypothetical protein
MNYAESDLIDNTETELAELASSDKAAILESTYSYDAAFMVGRDLPTKFIDGTSGDTEANHSEFPLAFSKSAPGSQASLDGEVMAEVEQLTIEQASKILGVTETQVKELIENDTLCCKDTDENDEPRLSAACVRAQAGKSKLEFVQEVKRLIAGENSKRRKTYVDMPDEADVCLQELFDAARPLGTVIPSGPGRTRGIQLRTGSVETAADSDAPQAGREIHIRGIDRNQITNKNLESVLENLDFTSVRLEGAMYRIGYLEAKLDDQNKEIQTMPELRAKWAKSLILERENEEYKETIARREHELLEIHQVLDKIKESWWCRAWCWFTGITLK